MSFLSRFFGSRQPDRKRSIGPPKESAKTYPGVELVVAPGGACAAAQARSGKRLLTFDAQPLPLPDCDQRHCKCGYRKFPDRRDEARRASDLAQEAVSDMYRHTGRGQRKGRGRRSTDATAR